MFYYNYGQLNEGNFSIIPQITHSIPHGHWKTYEMNEGIMGWRSHAPTGHGKCGFSFLRFLKPCSGKNHNYYNRKKKTTTEKPQ